MPEAKVFTFQCWHLTKCYNTLTTSVTSHSDLWFWQHLCGTGTYFYI